MQVIGDLFNLILLQPTINLIVVILRGFEALHIPGALGFSIILLTLIIRGLLWPVVGKQLRSAKQMADLKPHLDKIKEKHGSDKQALAKAQMDLYKEYGVNPAGGCLPAIVQILLIWPLYQVIIALLDGKAGLDKVNYFLYSKDWHLNSSPDPHFFGFNLADKPSDFSHVGVVVLIIPVLTAVLQFLLSKMMTPAPIKSYPTDSPKEKKEKESIDESMAAMQGQMVYIMPVMIGYFAFSFPVGMALYWNALTIMSMVQQYLISGWGGLNAPFLPNLPKLQKEPKTKVKIERLEAAPSKKKRG